MCSRCGAASWGTRIKWKSGDYDSRRPDGTKTPGLHVADASSPGIPSQTKMQDTERSECNHETENNLEVEVEKSDTISLNKSLNDSDLSFILLNKCNKETPNASMINTLNLSSPESNFNEKKISSLLRENMKLKEMLRQKSNSSRKQFNAIIALDREIRQICENYKQRFLEATDVIDQLKEDNSMLKANSSLNLSAKDKADCTENAPTARELNLIGQLRDLTGQLKDSQENYSKSQLKLKEIENKFTNEADNFQVALRKYQDEIEMMKENIVPPSPSDLLRSVNEHYKNELETKYLVELTTILKQNLDEKKLVEGENGESNDYKEKLHELFKCFTEHCANSLNVQGNFLDECSKVVQGFKNVEISFSEDFADDVTSQNDKIFNCKNALIDDQLQSIKDERTFKNIQIEFLKLYSDYNSVSNKMECLKTERFKEKDKKGASSEASVDNLAEIERCLLEEKKMIDSARVKLDEERLSIEKEKQNMREERELFDAERILLLEEKETIMEANKDIVNENLFLNREVAKLKKELSSRKDSASLEQELETVTAQYNEVKEKLKNSIETNSELSEEISKMMNKDEEIWAYKMQLEMQQNEFHEMDRAEQNFLIQIENLSREIRELREENTRLRQINAQRDDNY